MSRAPADARRSASCHPWFAVLVRVAPGILLAIVLLPLGAGSAAAHGGGETPVAAISMPRVLAVDPPVPGLDVLVVDGGARLRLDNHTGRRVTVPQSGTDSGKPRIVPAGGSLAWADPRLGDPAAPPPGNGTWEVRLSAGDMPVTVRGQQPLGAASTAPSGFSASPTPWRSTAP